MSGSIGRRNSRKRGCQDRQMRHHVREYFQIRFGFYRRYSTSRRCETTQMLMETKSVQLSITEIALSKPSTNG